MVWHILKKDARLLRFAVLALAITHLAIALLRCWLGLFPEPAGLANLADILTFVAVIGMAILTLAVMHEDAVPNLRQDWLIRPIRPLDMILAKLCFVLLLVQAPLFLADLLQALLQGFSLPAATLGAAARNLAVACFFTLPALVFGAVTRSFAEAFAVAAAGLVLYLAVFLIGIVMLLGMKTTIGGTGLSWLVAASWGGIAIAGTAVVLGLQFFRRTTTVARALIFTGGGLVILSAFVPWNLAFALQESLAAAPAAARTISLSFDPLLGPMQLPAGAGAPRGTVLYLPVRATGIPAAAIVVLDRATLRIGDGSGRTLYVGRSNLSVDGVGSISDAKMLLRQQATGAAPVDVHQRIFLPSAVYTRLRDRPVTLEVDYTLTLFRAGARYLLPATGADLHVTGLGRCGTRIDGEGDDVVLHCEDPARTPTCFSIALQDSTGGLHNPPSDSCYPDYAPLRAPLWPDALDHLYWEVPFFDRNGLVHYPVDGSKLDGARLAVQTYEPIDHFRRRLVVSGVRLSDFVRSRGI